MSIAKRLSLLLIPAYLVLIAVLSALHIQTVYEPPLLLPLLNTLFLGILPLAIAVIAARVYFKSDSLSVLLMGCGMLAFGVSSIAAGWVRGLPGGANMTVTLHNTGVFVGGLLHLLGSILNFVGRPSPDQPRIRKWTVAAAYGCLLVLGGLLIVATLRGLIPSFFVQGVGPTALRQLVLGTAVAFYFVSSLFFLRTYAKWRSDFLYWYSLGLVLIAIGLSAIFLEHAVGCPVGWLGRSAQYVSGVFFLAALVAASRRARDKSLPLARIIANFLADAETSYRDLVETARDAIVSFDSEGRIMGWNTAAEIMFGHTKDNAIGAPFYELLLPEELFPVLSEESQRVSVHPDNSHSGRLLEIDGRRRDGSLFPMEVSISVRELPSGRVTTCIMRDVTERKRAKDALTRSEAELHVIYEYAPVMMCVLGGQRKVLYVNRAFTEFLGKSQSEVKEGTACGVFGCINALDDPLGCGYGPHCESCIIRLAIEDTYNTGVGQRNIEWRSTLTLNGRKREVVLLASTGMVHADEQPRILLCLVDVTQRVQDEEALRQSEFRYRSLFDNMSDAVAVYQAVGDGEDFIFVEFNKSGEQIEGVRKQDLVGKSVLETFPGVREFGLFDAFQRVWRTGEPESHSVSLYRDERIEGWRENFVYRLPSGEIVAVYRDETDRQKARQALESEKKKFQALAESSPFGLVMIRQDGSYEYANPQFHEMFGYDLSEIPTGKEWLRKSFPDSDYRQEVIAAWLDDLESATPDRVRPRIFKTRCKDGTTKIIHFRPVLLPSGEHVVTYEDITDRQKAEEAIRESEEKYRNIFENAVEGMFQSMPEGRLISVNPAYARMFGYGSPEEMVREVTDVASQVYANPADREVVKQRLRDAAPLTNYELRCRRRDGALFWVSMNARSVRDESGRILYYEGTTEDITARKDAEKARLESEARYGMLFNDSKDGVYVTSRDGQVLEANQAYLDLLGYSREEMVGGDVRVTYANPSDRDSFVQAIEGNGFLKDYALPFRRKDGKQIDCLITASVRRAEDGSVLGYHGIMRDVTEQKNLQLQLLQEQKMEAIGTLAGGIAHDFNNILQVALGYSELLLAGKTVRDPDYDDLRKIYHAARSGADLVRNLLTFSRKVEPKPVPMDFNSQVQKVEKLLHRIIPRMIDIRLELADDLKRTNADPGQIEQIIMNLSVNARDAIGDSGSLTFRTENVTLGEEYCKLNMEAKPGDYVLLSVSDTGHGMDRETLQHIFEPFYTTKELGRGTGLGLAMVYGIVKQHNGHLTCYSEVGKGTTFRVYLPAVLSEPEDVADSVAEMPAFGTETLLLVDDEDSVRGLGERILTKNGYTVLIATNGEEALAMYSEKRDQISLVLLDLIMPSMGGKDCLHELLEIDPAVKVLIASGYAGDETTRECIRLGAKGFVAKPYRFKDLLQQVRKALDER